LKVLSEEYPFSLSNITSLISIYKNQGRWKEAEELDVYIIKTKKRVLGEEYPDMLINIANLITIY